MALTFPTVAGKSQTDPIAPFNASATGKFIAAPDAATNTQRFADLLDASRIESGTAVAGVKDAQPSVSATNEETENQFMALLVAQMRNQDPLNPLDNAEVTTQLAQINTVRGIDEMNKQLVTLTGKFDGGNPADSASMIGRRVLVPGDRFELGKGSELALTGGAEFAAPTPASQVDIFNAAGSVVRTISLGAQPAGLATFEWDGLDDQGSDLPLGEYGFRVLGQGENGAVTASPFTAPVVTGVTRAGEGLSLRLEEGAVVPADSIRGVF